jgi:hypothetical protein
MMKRYRFPLPYCSGTKEDHAGCRTDCQSVLRPGPALWQGGIALASYSGATQRKPIVADPARVDAVISASFAGRCQGVNASFLNGAPPALTTGRDRP